MLKNLEQYFSKSWKVLHKLGMYFVLSCKSYKKLQCFGNYRKLVQNTTKTVKDPKMQRNPNRCKRMQKNAKGWFLSNRKWLEFPVSIECSKKVKSLLAGASFWVQSSSSVEIKSIGYPSFLHISLDLHYFIKKFIQKRPFLTCFS